MTSELKCPYCNKPLQPTLSDSYGYWCENYDCPVTSIEWVGSQKLWQELAQVKQDLKIATKALESISGIRENTEDYYGGVSIHYQQMVLHMDEIATNALEQIKHKE